jgi:hypothetical protein
MTVGAYHLRIDRKIGEGAFSVVYQVTSAPSNGSGQRRGSQTHVAKLINTARPEVKALAATEVKLMRQLQHPNIVSLIAHQQTPKYMAVLMEHCRGGDMWTCLKSRDGEFLPERSVWHIFTSACRAVAHMHGQSPAIAHWDIKMENLLKGQGEDGRVAIKLCDFGSCQVPGTMPLNTAAQRRRAKDLIEQYTSPAYRAPEQCDFFGHSELTTKVDVWALGCVLYCLAFQKHPFRDAGNLGILAGKWEMPGQHSFSAGLKRALERCFEPDPSARADVFELLERADSGARGKTFKEPEAARSAAKARRENAAEAEAEEARKKRRQARKKREKAEAARRAERMKRAAAAKRAAAKGTSGGRPARGAERGGGSAWNDDEDDGWSGVDDNAADDDDVWGIGDGGAADAWGETTGAPEDAAAPSTANASESNVSDSNVSESNVSGDASGLADIQDAFAEEASEDPLGASGASLFDEAMAAPSGKASAPGIEPAPAAGAPGKPPSPSRALAIEAAFGNVAEDVERDRIIAQQQQQRYLAQQQQARRMQQQQQAYFARQQQQRIAQAQQAQQQWATSRTQGGNVFDAFGGGAAQPPQWPGSAGAAGGGGGGGVPDWNF